MSQMTGVVDEMHDAEETGTENTSAQPRRVSPLALLVFGVVIVMGIVFGLGLSRQNVSQPTSGLAPDFSIKTFDGETLQLSALRGKVVMINFWASWCGPCRSEAPELQAAWEKYKDKDVIFLGVAYTDTERNAKAFLKEFNTTYPNGLDIGTRISELYHITGVPETFIIDRDGKIAEFVMMPLNRATLGARLDKALSQPMARTGASQ